MVSQQTTTVARRGVGFDVRSLTWAHWSAAVLAAVTGAIHVYLYVQQGFLPFLFAGVVFFAAIVAMVLNVYPRVLYALGVPFTAGQILLWYLQGMPDMSVAVVDKPVQILLIVVLAYLFLAESRRVSA